MKKIVVLTIVSVFLFGASAMATPNYAAIESVLNGIAVDGDINLDVQKDVIDDTIDSNWEITASGGSVATFIIEIAGYAGSNALGIYDAVDPSKKVVLFDGAGGQGDQVMISIKEDGSVYKFGQKTGITFAGNFFGYYLDATVGNQNQNAVFYSDTNLNTDAVDHMLAYQGNGERVKLPTFNEGEWTVNEYVLAFEDLYGGGDWSYDDLVIMVESVKTKPVPEPGTMFLLGSGILGLAGIRRKKMNK